MRQRQLNQREEGFTLVELIVAMMIITVILVSLIGVQLSAMVSVTEARKLEQATALANESLEQLRAIPWSVLSQGMHSDFISASGGDDLVHDGLLDVDGQTDQILVAGAGQQTGQWLPLFDAAGSNRQVKADPSGTGIEFVVRTYLLTRGLGGDTGTLGAVVVVDWDGKGDERRHTTIRSTIYPSGCGDNDANPFASSCQPYLDASATGGHVSFSVSATDDGEPPITAPLGWPASDGYFAMDMRTQSVVASVQSQQVDLADASVQFGGTTRTTDDPDAVGASSGFATEEVRSSNDLTSQDIWPPHVAPTTFAQVTTAESAGIVGGSGSLISIASRSDLGRDATIGASLQQSCFAGIAAGETCSLASSAHDSSDSGVGYATMTVDSVVIDLMRQAKTGGQNADRAWSGRFTETGGASDIGCTTLTGAGCTAAGATRTLAPVTIGNIGSGAWDGDAVDGIAILEGRAACSSFADSVRLEMGPGQLVSEPVVSRCGQLRYWNGTDYSTVSINDSTSESVTTEPVTWTHDTITVTAQATVTITAPYRELPAGECPDVSCTKSANAGSVLVSTVYSVDDGSGVHRVITGVEVVGPSARAAYSLTESADAEG